MTLTTPPVPEPGRPATGRWLGDVPGQSLAAGAAAATGGLSMVFAYAVEGGWSGALELALVVAAVAALFLAPPRFSSFVSVGSVAAFGLVELFAGRYAQGLSWGDVARPFALAGVLVAASLLRYSIRRRDTELAVAAEAIGELTRRDRVIELLTGGVEPTWLEAELARSQRHHHQLALVLVRPDRFAALSSLSPGAGQEILEAVAEVIGSELRSIDVALRHDPDTFALILPETPTDGARVAAERIRLSLPLRLGSFSGAQITLSLGVAAFPDDADAHDALVSCALQALERAIELGGNRTVCASVPATSPPGWTIAGARPH